MTVPLLEYIMYSGLDVHSMLQQDCKQCRFGEIKAFLVLHKSKCNVECNLSLHR